MHQEIATNRCHCGSVVLMAPYTKDANYDAAKRAEGGDDACELTDLFDVRDS